VGCDKILIAPVLLPDVIEGHANEHGNVMVVEGNTRTFMQSPTDGAPPGAPDVVPQCFWCRLRLSGLSCH